MLCYVFLFETHVHHRNPRLTQDLSSVSCVSVHLQDLKFPPRGMENQTNPASWPWFQLMSDALEGRLAGKAPRVTPIWNNEEDGAFVSSPPPDRDCMMAERSSVSELESMVGGDGADGEGNITYIDASGEECSTPSDLSYKSEAQIDVRHNYR